MHLWPLRCVPHTPTILFSLIWTPKWYLVQRSSYEVACLRKLTFWASILNRDSYEEFVQLILPVNLLHCYTSFTKFNQCMHTHAGEVATKCWPLLIGHEPLMRLALYFCCLQQNNKHSAHQHTYSDRVKSALMSRGQWLVFGCDKKRSGFRNSVPAVD
jgi:hypothetical protein